MKLVAFMLGALAGAGVVAAVLAVQSRTLGAQGASLQASLVAGGDDLRTYFLAQRAEFEAQLTRTGQREAERAARRAAEGYLASEYGITAQRVAAVRRLAQRWS